MRKLAGIALAVLCAAVVSCGRFTSRGDGSPVRIPVLFRAVPSDALALVSGPEASAVMSYYDSTSALRRLDLGGLAGSRAVLSLNYYTAPVPVLTIDTGRGTDEVNPELQTVADRASDAGFKTAVRVLDDGGRGHRVLIICPSETVLNTVLRHIDESASIADVPLFREACAAAEGASSCMIARPSAAARLLPSSFLAEVFPRRQLVNFAVTTASWIVLKGDAGRFSVVPVSDGAGRLFADFLCPLKSSSCRVGKILPAGTRYVLDFPVKSVESFRRAVETYRDADISLGRYRDSLKALRRATGHDPLLWEKELGIREIAAVRTDSATVLLLRPAGKPAAAEIAENPYRRFIPALYGRAFDLCDDFVAPCGRWLVFGSRQDVSQFISTEHQGVETASKCKLMCLTPRFALTCGESDNLLEFR